MNDCRFGVSPVNYPDPEPVSDAEIPVEYAIKYPAGVDNLINFVYFDKSQIVETNGITK